jgi:hypothetical protein
MQLPPLQLDYIGIELAVFQQAIDPHLPNPHPPSAKKDLT